MRRSGRLCIVELTLIGAGRPFGSLFHDPNLLLNERADDRTAYGVMNAVTATAREAGDAGMRWEMEELGGAVVARVDPCGPGKPLAAAMAATAG